MKISLTKLFAQDGKSEKYESGDSQQNGCFDGFRNDCGAGME